MENKYDFGGWATRNNLLCSDGRTIMKDAFKSNDGQVVPLVWNHQHNDPDNVLGHALLENRDDGVYAYCKFNDTPSGQNAKLLVEHGDISSLSICANKLKQRGKDVLGGIIREVSLVIAGANPGATIESVVCHDSEAGETAIIDVGFLNADLAFGDIISEDDIKHAEAKMEDKKMAEDSTKDSTKDSEKSTESEKTVQEIIDGMDEDERTVLYALVGEARMAPKDNETDNGGKDDMKHNVFDGEEQNTNDGVITHSEGIELIQFAKDNHMSLKRVVKDYASDNESLTHGIDDIETLFPEYKDVRPGAPEMITRDQTWVSKVIAGTHKSPISRIRTRQADVRGADQRAYGYQKGRYKKYSGNIKLLKRTTDPQTIYVRDALHRDDIIDITDFDVVNYQYQIMRMNLNEEIATAIMIGDGRDDGDENKISEEHIRPIWTDDDLYTIHQDVDLEGMKKSLQGTDTGANFGENYIYAEAIIQSALYAREKYKGSGSLEFYCTPHLLNVMLLARDLNGRRIYSSVTDLAAALNVTSINTAEQFENKTRSTSDGKTKKLLGLFVNLSDYQVGSTKGGEITRFNQFDIDFNQEKYLLEARMSGALTRVYSAIALEEDVTE